MNIPHFHLYGILVKSLSCSLKNLTIGDQRYKNVSLISIINGKNQILFCDIQMTLFPNFPDNRGLLLFDNFDFSMNLRNVFKNVFHEYNWKIKLNHIAFRSTLIFM